MCAYVLWILNKNGKDSTYGTINISPQQCIGKNSLETFSFRMNAQIDLLTIANTLGVQRQKFRQFLFFFFTFGNIQIFNIASKRKIYLQHIYVMWLFSQSRKKNVSTFCLYSMSSCILCYCWVVVYGQYHHCGFYSSRAKLLLTIFRL